MLKVELKGASESCYQKEGKGYAEVGLWTLDFGLSTLDFAFCPVSMEHRRPKPQGQKPAGLIINRFQQLIRSSLIKGLQRSILFHRHVAVTHSFVG